VKPSRHACAGVRRLGRLHRGEEFVAAKAGAQEDVDEVAGDAAWQW
jgi:hypothetical protein